MERIYEHWPNYETVDGPYDDINNARNAAAQYPGGRVWYDPHGGEAFSGYYVERPAQ